MFRNPFSLSDVRDGSLIIIIIIIIKVIWGGGEVQKKYSRKGKLNEKNSCTPINPKKYSCYGLKLKFMKEFDNEKNFRGTKIPHPPPPHNSSNGPSLIDKISLRDPQCPAFL